VTSLCLCDSVMNLQIFGTRLRNGSRRTNLPKARISYFPLHLSATGYNQSGPQPPGILQKYLTGASRLGEPACSIELRGNTLSTEPRVLHSNATH